MSEFYPHTPVDAAADWHALTCQLTDAGRYFTALEAANRGDLHPLVDIWRDRLTLAETTDD